VQVLEVVGVPRVVLELERAPLEQREAVPARRVRLARPLQVAPPRVERVGATRARFDLRLPRVARRVVLAADRVERRLVQRRERLAAAAGAQRLRVLLRGVPLCEGGGG